MKPGISFFLIWIFLLPGAIARQAAHAPDPEEKWMQHLLSLELKVSLPDPGADHFSSTSSYYFHYAQVLRILFYQEPGIILQFKKNERQFLSSLEGSASRRDRYRLAEMNLLSSLAWFSAGEEITALNRFRKSATIFSGMDPDPGDPAYLHLQAIFHFAGTYLPAPLRIFLPRAFSRGNYQEELKRAEHLLEPGSPSRQETELVHAILLLLDDQPEAAAALLAAHPRSQTLSLLFRLVALKKAGKNEEVLRLLSGIDRPFPHPYFSYLYGEALLRKLDPGTGNLLEAFLEQSGPVHFRKMAMLKLAWWRFLEGRTGEARALAGEITGSAEALTESDRQAVSEARAFPYWNVSLLRARMLFDGGYYRKALEEIRKGAPGEGLHTGREQLEYYYRLGRILEALDKPREALKSYDQAVALGADAPYYFPAYAAWHMGNILEASGQPDEARRFYQKCLEMKTIEYRSDIRRKARASIRSLSDAEAQ